LRSHLPFLRRLETDHGQQVVNRPRCRAPTRLPVGQARRGVQGQTPIMNGRPPGVFDMFARGLPHDNVARRAANTSRPSSPAPSTSAAGISRGPRRPQRAPCPGASRTADRVQPSLHPFGPPSSRKPGGSPAAARDQRRRSGPRAACAPRVDGCRSGFTTRGRSRTAIILRGPAAPRRGIPPRAAPARPARSHYPAADQPRVVAGSPLPKARAGHRHFPAAAADCGRHSLGGVARRGRVAAPPSASSNRGFPIPARALSPAIPPAVPPAGRDLDDPGAGTESAAGRPRGPVPARGGCRRVPSLTVPGGGCPRSGPAMWAHLGRRRASSLGRPGLASLGQAAPSPRSSPGTASPGVTPPICWSSRPLA